MAQQHESAGNSAASGNAATSGPSSLDQARSARSAGASSLPTSRVNLALEASYQIGALSRALAEEARRTPDSMFQEACSVRIHQLSNWIVTALVDLEHAEDRIHFCVHGEYPQRGGDRA